MSPVRSSISGSEAKSPYVAVVDLNNLSVAREPLERLELNNAGEVSQ
jgi:hypothetical protein